MAQQVGINSQPEITLNGDDPTLFSFENISVYGIPDLSAAAFDREDGDITGSIQVTGQHSGNGEYILTYSVSDANGLSATPLTRVVNVAGVSPETYLNGYLGIDRDNDTDEVLKLQTFLKDNEGMDTVELTGVFDEGTRNAVLAFQEKYSADILDPWGITEPTGYVYVTTKHKIDDLYFNRDTPLNSHELLAMNASSDDAEGGSHGSMGGSEDEDPFVTSISSGGETNEGDDGGLTVLNSGFGGIKNIDLAAIVAFPVGFEQTYDALIDLLLILFIITVLWLIARQVFFSEDKIGTKKLERTRTIFFSVTTFAAAIASGVTGLQYVSVPLIAISIFLVAYMIFSRSNKNKTDTTKKTQALMKIK